MIQVTEDMSSEEIEMQIGLAQRAHRSDLADLMREYRVRMLDFQTALNQARERERREFIERDSTAR